MVDQLESRSAIDNHRRMTLGNGVFLQHHRPRTMDDNYHVHPSIEVNYLRDCNLTYSFGGDLVHVPRHRFCIFWAAQPHRVVSVTGVGTITNAHLSLGEFLGWRLPSDFVASLMAGAVISASHPTDGDDALASRLASEVQTTSEAMSSLHCLELQARITRLAMSRWERIGLIHQETNGAQTSGNGVVYFEKMLRHIGARFNDPITLADVAGSASISDNYANTLFKNFLGSTIKAYIRDLRVNHARMLLSETDEKVINIALDCGFKSLSSFYDAFQKLAATSPAEYRRRSAALRHEELQDDPALL